MPARVGGATGLVAAPPPPHPPGPQPKLNEIAGRGSGAPARGCVRGVGAGLAAVAPPGAPSARVNPHTFCASFATRAAPRLRAAPPDFSFFRRPCTAVIAQLSPPPARAPAACGTRMVGLAHARGVVKLARTCGGGHWPSGCPTTPPPARPSAETERNCGPRQWCARARLCTGRGCWLGRGCPPWGAVGTSKSAHVLRIVCYKDRP